MLMAELMLATGLSLAMVPPNEPTVNHAHPLHYGQPTIRRFERRDEDNDRRRAWEAYVVELTDLWRDYVDAGRTPRAWRTYKESAAEAKRRYVYDDIYLAPVLP
jgi:hypothetical protein